MNRDILLYKICPMDRIYDCCNGNDNYHCDDCKRVMNEWLDKYDKQIRAAAIDDFVNACKGNTLCQTLGLRQCDIDGIAEQLKEGGKE